MLELRKAVTYTPALALVKAGISMPSHSLRLCWCNSDRGHKGSARPRVQLRPNAAANPEHLADFSRTLGGNLPEQRVDFPVNGADFSVNGADFWAENYPNKGQKN